MLLNVSNTIFVFLNTFFFSRYHDHPEEIESKDQTADGSSNSPATTSGSAHNKAD